MLENAGPLRNDGSDKFWGMENVSISFNFSAVSHKTLNADISSA